MILKGFKENSNKKYIESQLRERIVVNQEVAITTLGIFVSADEVADYEWFTTLANDLKIKQHKVKLIVFTENEVETTQFSGVIVTPETIGWKGTIKDGEVQAFVNTKFDALISYYKQDKIPLKLITAASKAVFKIGIFENDNRLNDLIIKTEINDTKTFKTELLKYLHTLNRINK